MTDVIWQLADWAISIGVIYYTLRWVYRLGEERAVERWKLKWQLRRERLHLEDTDE